MQKDLYISVKINEVNSVLKDLCVINGFAFIGNADINHSDICDDLLHLKYSGTYKLANNLNKVLDTRNF